MALRLLPEPELLGALDDARLARILDERARALAARSQAAPDLTAAPILVAAVGSERFGIPLKALLEVLPAAAPSPIPGAQAAMLGLRARAGRLYAVLDLGAALGLAVSGAGAHDLLLRPLPAHPSRRFALRVDRAETSVRPVPLAHEADEADGPVAFRATVPHAPDAPVIAVLDLGRLLRPYLRADAPSPSS